MPPVQAAAANRKREVGYSEGKRRAARQARITENLLLLLNFLNTSAVSFRERMERMEHEVIQTSMHGHDVMGIMV